MYYKAELDYLIKMLKKMRVQAICTSPNELINRRLDFGLRRLFGLDEYYERAFRNNGQWAGENTVYRLTDEFKCSYVFMLLPAAAEAAALLVGPYMTFEKTREQLLEEAERYRVPAWRFQQIESCYAHIPVLRDESPLFTLISVFGETLWGDAFEIVEIGHEPAGSSVILPGREDNREPEDILLHLEAMETRYAYENELMKMVSQGRVRRAELMLSGFSKQAIEQRVSDPVRNQKNYCIICNTLLRKAAEQGGVHPVHLNSTSAEFAKRIEAIKSTDGGRELMGEMVRTYCRLVRKHSIKHYSPLVQKTVAYIESDLSGDLSLRALAALQNINASYLSTLFRKETGKTITEYVKEKRMDTAVGLLRGTHLQIQTVAQHCGISDVNYFSKVFKKHYGVTPKQFREESRGCPPKGQK